MMKEITFTVDHDEASGMLVASWDDPSGKGGITTQGCDANELEAMVREAVACHFDSSKTPWDICLNFMDVPTLAAA